MSPLCYNFSILCYGDRMENFNSKKRKNWLSLFVRIIPFVFLAIVLLNVIHIYSEGDKGYQEREIQIKNRINMIVDTYSLGIGLSNGKNLTDSPDFLKDVTTGLLANQYLNDNLNPCLYYGQGFIVLNQDSNAISPDFNPEINERLLNLAAKSGFSDILVSEIGKIKFWKGNVEKYVVFSKKIYQGTDLVLLVFADYDYLHASSIHIPILILIFSLFGFIFSILYSIKNKSQTAALNTSEPDNTVSNPEFEISQEHNITYKYMLEKLVEISSKMSLASRKRDDAFLKELLEMLLSLIPKADYGTISVIREGKWDFIHSVGHNIDILKEVNINSKQTKKIGKTTMVENLYDHECGVIPGESVEGIREATKPTSTSLITPLMIGKDQIGSINIDIARDKDELFNSFEIHLVDMFSGLATSFLAIQEYMKTQGKFQKQIIMSLIKALEIHDPYTRGHSENVASMAAQIAEEMGWPIEKISRVYWAGLIHDIGKIFVPPTILCKPGKLTEAEFDTIKKHPVWGAEVLGSSEGLEDLELCVKYHHERWDGRGYPEGLKGEEIPIVSRIISVSDAYDAMISTRPYRPSVSKEEAIKEIEKNSGVQFDPAIVKVFSKVISEEKELAQKYSKK